LKSIFFAFKLLKLRVYEMVSFLLKRGTLLVVLYFLPGIAYSQNHTLDSLIAIIEKQDGIQKFEPIVDVVREYTKTDYNKSLEYIDIAENLALEKGDSARIVRARRIKGQLLNRVERPKESIEVLTNALPIAKRNNYREDYKVILNNLAMGYAIQAEYDKALEIHFKTLVLREEDKDKAEISISLNNIGFVYFKLKNYERAIEYFNRALTLKKEVGDTYDLDRLLINIGLSNIHLKNFTEAQARINEGLSICGSNCDRQITIEGQFGLGVCQYNLKDLDLASTHFKKSLLIAEEINNERFQAENLIYMARISIKQHEETGAISHLKRAEKISLSSGYNQLLMDAYKEFSNLYRLSNNFQEASIYQDRYIDLKDSLIGEELVKNIAKIQTNFEERENLNTIKLKEEDLVRQRNLNIAIGIIAVLAGLLVFVLYRSNAITRKVNSALSDAKAIIETQNHRLQNINRELDAKVKEKTADLVKANEDLDKANKSLIRVNDELDNFIYKTSHDIRGPLASLKGICSVALMDVKDPLALDYLNKLDVSSGRLNVILTRLLIVNQINHAIVGREPIDFNGIIDDVLLLERKKGLPSRLEIRREIDKNISFLSDKDLVRIILENLIDNSIKFYNDSDRTQPFVHIRISLLDDKDVIVSVIDNGIGIAEAKPDKIFQMFSRASERSGTGGIGLYLSKLATEKLGGQINLRSTPEGHTEFFVSFPLKMQLV
jgi:signal transduction histidine kinase